MILNLTPILRSGNPLYGIITTARERAADLIVIATHGYTGAKRALLGSTAERVVRHAPCPGAHRSGSHHSKAHEQNASARPEENPCPD